MLKLQCFMIKAYCVLFLGGTERVIMPQNLNNNVNGNGYAPTTNENIHKTVVGIIITLIVVSMIAAICIAAFNSSRNSNNSNVAKKENYKVVINDLRGKDSPANFNKTGGILQASLVTISLLMALLPWLCILIHFAQVVANLAVMSTSISLT